MSSAKQTDRPGARKKRSEPRKPNGALASKPRSMGSLWSVWLVPLVAGWLFVLKIHHWHFGPSTLLLFTGWLAVLLTAGFLLQAGLAAVRGGAGGDANFWRPEGRRDELVREKKALLKAIKEIEFDHQLGKISDDDAAKLSKFYRARAIEIMKVLDGKVEPAGGAGAETDSMSPRERIERDVAARLDAVAAESDKNGAGAGETQDSLADDEEEPS